MAKVYRITPKIKIWIVGDAPKSKESYKEQIRVLVRRLGLEHSTEFLGIQHDIPAVMKQLDLLVLATTTQEAFGRVIIEAQAAGVPVIATSVGGVIDIIEENKTGLLVPPLDPNSMAEAIVKILENKELARKLAENAYQKVKEKYNVSLMVESTLEVYQEAQQSFSILIIKLSSLGDIILSTAALRAIRDKFPFGQYKISFLVGEESKDLLLRCPYIDELLVCNLKDKDKGIKGLLNLGETLRRKNFDIVIDLQNNRKSHILSRLSFALDRYGYDNKKWSFLLNHRIKDNLNPLTPVEHQFRVLEMLGIKLQDPHLELWPSEEDDAYIDNLLKSEWLSPGSKIIGINIGASKRWATKVWPLEAIKKLCDELGHRDLRVVITGTDADIPYANKLISSIKDNKPINACGKTTINQLVCLIKKCSVYICADSAPLHIAVATNTPFIALFGPTDPKRHLVTTGEHILIKKDLPCSPCYKPRCKTNKCMESISVQEVIEAVDKLLK
jgi:lipopolysaccharide heptosyltransferase II